MSTDLTQHSTIRTLVDAYQECAAAIRRAFGIIVTAEERVNQVFTLGGDHPMRIDASRYGYHDSFDDPEYAIDRIKRQAWGVIVERLELRRMLSIKRWDELQKQLKDGELPDITEESIANFVEGYMTSFESLIREAVVEVFDWLRPRREHYKTNNREIVGPKVVLEYMVSTRWSGKGFEVNYSKEQRLNALENVFSALDGKGSISKSYRSALENAIRESPDGRAETDYFRVRCFHNHNMHLEFKRRDLLARFNSIAGGKNLTTEGATSTCPS
jgi:hypothetical protein